MYVYTCRQSGPIRWRGCQSHTRRRRFSHTSLGRERERNIYTYMYVSRYVYPSIYLSIHLSIIYICVCVRACT